MTDRGAGFIGLSREMLSRGGTVRFRTSGSSMYPFIRDGDIVRVEPAGISQARYADIVFFNSDDGKMVVHRVVGKKKVCGRELLVTKGDSLPKADGFLDERSLIGRVVAVERDGCIFPICKGVRRAANVIYAALLPLSKEAFILISVMFQARADYAPAGKPIAKYEYYKNAARNTVIYKEAKNIIKAFNRQDIRTIILKGIFLAENVYNNIALRPMTDIDILIKKEDLPRANELLNILEYPSPINYKDFLDVDIPCPINSIMYFASDRRRPAVHLHWHLINSTWPLDLLVARIDMEDIWSSARKARIGDVETLTLSPEHLLIYLAYHGFQHSFDKQAMISDAVEVLRFYGEQIDWKTVKKEAEKFGLDFIVYAALKYVSKSLSSTITHLELLRPKEPGLLERSILRKMNDGVCSYCISYLAYLSIQKRGRERLRFIFKILFPPPLILSHNLGLPLSQIRPFHYITRIAGGLNP